MNRKSLIISALRKIWLWSDERRDALKQAKARKNYRCAKCQKLFPKKGVQVDHIDPIGTFINWDTYIERLFCPITNLQVLCKSCHKNKGN